MSGFLCSMVGASFSVAAVVTILRSKKGISANGNAKVSTAQSKFGGASAYFDGADDYLKVLETPEIGTGDFTIECWAYVSNVSGSKALLSIGSEASGRFLCMLINQAIKYDYYGYGDETNNSGTYNVSANTWTHLAWVRSGSTLNMYVNGAQATKTLNGTAVGTNSVGNTGGWWIGTNASITDDYPGYMDEIRISNSARYTTTFTPSTTPFVNDADTLLLIHADGTNNSTYFEDDNGLTRAPINAWQPESGVVISSTQSKFGGTSLYTPGSATLYHGQYSGASNGNALINFGTGDFTLEFWIYPTSTATTSGVITKRNNSNTANGTWGIYYNGSTRTVNWQNIFPSVTTTSTASSAFSLNAWSHWAFVRSSGTFKIYVDGVEKASASNSLDFTFNSEPIRIGDWDTGSTNGHIGYLDELRMSNSARYTGTFTPSTTPFVNDANTLLLMHMDGTPSVAVFRDDNGARAQKGIQAIGNAQISTSQSKFGGTSAAFDGTGDALTINHEGSMRFGTGDFTMECWVRPTSRAQNYPVVFSNKAGYDAGNIVFHDRHSSNTTKFTVWIYNLNTGAPSFTSTTSVSDGTWYHLALSRSGTSLKFFVNGIQEGSTVTTSTDIDTGAGTIPYYVSSTTSTAEFNGFIDEVRVSNTARYTANFTAPTAPFQSDANTLLLLHCDGTNTSTAFFDDNGLAPYTV